MIVAGVDEAGRGPLAGPVVASAVILREPIPGLNDSKKLSASKRQLLFYKITSEALAWSYATATPAEIDQLNIREATRLAMVRAVMALRHHPDLVLVDGRDTIEIPYPCEALIKGDSKNQNIMAASIVAKTRRDMMMEVIAKLCPVYQFDQHKGYPTELHQSMIKAHGVSSYHRKSFRPCKI